jgi:hypothetical protein
MAKPISTKELRKYSITTGAVLDERYMTVVLTNDARTKKDPEDYHSYIALRINGAWHLSKPMQNAYRSQVVVDKPSRSIISVSAVGVVRHSNPAPLGGHQEANIGDASGKRVQGRTRISEVRSIEGSAYVAGSRRSVYRRDAPDIWKCLDQGCYTPDGPALSFRSIHGFSKSEIYAVGEKGDLWEFNGKKWKQYKLPTTEKLRKVLCAEDVVYVVGSGGTIIRGRHSKWEILKGLEEGYDFLGLEFFNGKVFLTANSTFVLELKKNKVRLVDFGECPIPSTSYHLSVSGDSLYSFGAKDIRRFDGKTWHDELTL